MKRILLLGLFISFASCLSAESKDLLVLDFKQAKTEIIEEYIKIFETTVKNLTFNEIAADSFEALPDFVDREGVFRRNRDYWFQIQVMNRSSKSCEYILDFSDISYMDIFIVDQKGSFEKSRTGTLVSASEKQMKSTIRDTIVFSLQAQETKTIYFKVRFDLDLKMLSPFYISDTKSYINQATGENLVQGVFQGLLWMILLYNLFLYISTREKSYLYYIVYVFSFSVLMLYAHQYFNDYFFIEHPEISYFLSVFVFVALLFYYLFMREFIESRSKHPRLDRALSIIIKINLAVTLFMFFGQFLYINTFELVGIPFVLLDMATLSVLAFFIFKYGNKVSRIFVLGTLVMIVCMSTASIATVFVGTSVELIILFQGGVVGEVFIFSIGLSYKYRMVELDKQKAQKDLIDQLTENHNLQTMVNRELEQKVRERTVEISQQKDEIQRIADDLLVANTAITQQNRNITASIEYAKRIQTAMLPDHEQLSDILPRHFVLYKPRDIVSGDFYWAQKVDHYLIVAAADCTGHGVPGAFVSMLGISLLNEIVSKLESKKPNDILGTLRERIKSSLKQTIEKGSSKDGMDIALCVIDIHTGSMQYSGAYNPIYIIRNKDLIEIKATRSPVGLCLKEKAFVNNDFKLQKDDKIYLFSDGYMDQFGGEKGKKYMRKRFKEILLEISENPFEEQKKALNNNIDDWRNDREQNDDILVFGFEMAAS